MRRGVVIGGGGTLGLAWSVGALAAVEEALEWDARLATVILGSGSGAEVAAALGASFSTRDLVNALTGHPGAPQLLVEHFAGELHVLPSIPLPAPLSLGLAIAGLRRRVPVQSSISGLMPVGTGSFDRVVEFGRSLAQLSTGAPNGWVAHPATWLVAAERRSGRRVPFGFGGAPRTDLGIALAAASARPGWFPPVRVHDRAYVEASVASPASADLLLPLQLDEVIVIAPTTSRDAGLGLGLGLAMVERLFRRGTTMRLDLEEAVLKADGTRVIRIEPGPEDLQVMGVNPMDYRRRRTVALTSLSTSRGRVAEAISRSGSGFLEPTLARNDGLVPIMVGQPIPALAEGRLLVDEVAEAAVPMALESVSEPTLGPLPRPTLSRRLRRWFGSGRPAE